MNLKTLDEFHESIKGQIGKAVVSLSMFASIHHLGSDCHTKYLCVIFAWAYSVHFCMCVCVCVHVCVHVCVFGELEVGGGDGGLLPCVWY